jgi:membrane-associated protein
MAGRRCPVDPDQATTPQHAPKELCERRAVMILLGSYMLDAAHHLPVALILLSAGVILFVEAGLLIGLAFPGISTTLVLGFLTHSDNGDVPLVVACLTAIAATFMGAHYGYLRGRRRGDRPATAGSGSASGPIARWLDRVINSRRLGFALSLVERRATLSIPVGHCIGGLRTLVPRAAGRAGVPRWKFTLCNGPAAVFWGAATVLAGHAAKAALDRVDEALNRSGWLLLLLVCAGLIAVGRARAWRTRGAGS